uniref:40S ribosomal protein S8 n=1 Tax=Flustra foliacea TaxID=478208 RepID=A9UDN7_9BILA|nr:putative 40S ribosomal protein RPS8 [Flustra foliacea]
MGISRDKWHKRRKTGGRKTQIRGKRKFEMGRAPANTKLGHKRIHSVRTMGGNTKLRALRLDTGNFAWGSEGISHKSRIIDVVYNATNNEMVRTKTLTKNTIVQIDAAPFRQWYEAHYALPLGRKKTSEKKFTDEEKAELPYLKKRSHKTQKKYDERKKTAFVDPAVEEQFVAGKLYACISSRPGKCGRSDGYILEGQELQFYVRKMKAKKGNKL